MLLLACDAEGGTLEAATVEHQRRLSGRRFLKVDRRRLCRRGVLNRRNLPAESVNCER